MNLCRGCGEDFGSVGAFDAHRVGVFDYTFEQGLALDPPVENGRRCLSTGELVAKKWKKDKFGRWRQPGTNPYSRKKEEE